jgi:hypothetical protein
LNQKLTHHEVPKQDRIFNFQIHNSVKVPWSKSL